MRQSTKTLIRFGLHLAYRVMPDKLFDRFYDYGFSAYKKRLRSKYYRKVITAKSSGDAATAKRAEWVHAVMPYSLVGSSGLEATYDLAKAAVDGNLRGAFVECGVAQGGCAALLAHIAADEGLNRHCWFFDSYEGLPDPTDDDFTTGRTGAHVRPLPRGACLGTYEQVSELLFEKFRFSPHNISMVKGWFQDTIPEMRDTIGSIALLRLDGDWYESTKCCLENLYDQVVDGGFIIIDDYFTCHGSQKATDEFREYLGIATEMVPDGRGGCSFRKPCLITAAA